MDPHNPPSSPNQLPLIPRDSTFSQQGTINWDNIVYQSITYSIGVLKRCANAGVDPYSLVVGQAIAHSFPLAPRGHKRIHKAIGTLQSEKSIADTLWFGFGVQALVRTLALTSEGTSLLALCASLGECFHKDLAAEVMFHIVKAYNAPGELAPSTAQWSNMIRACSGCLATSKFPLLVEGILRLDPNSTRTTRRLDHFNGFASVRGCPLPEDLSSVIIAVGKVATGQLGSIHISGCAAVGWVAAIAQWLFDLRVAVFSSPDDTVPVHSNCVENQDAQVYLSFDRNPSTSTSQPRLCLVQKFYLLNDSSSLLSQSVGLSETALFSGRVPWQTCLTDTFGSDFHKLREVPLNFGTALGCAARIFKAVMKAEPGIPKSFLTDFRGYFNASGGQGFIHNTLHWFPELESIRPAMEKASRYSFDQAKDIYEEKFCTVRRLCDCGVCRDFQEFEEGEGFCQVAVMETIITLCQITAGLTVAEGLYPVRSGLEKIYNHQVFAHRSRKFEKADLETLGPIFYVLRVKPTVKLEEISLAMEHRLVAATELFTGREAPTDPLCSAVTESGICAYLDILRDFSIAPECTGRVHVMPGMIEHQHRQFSQVKDNEIVLRRSRGSFNTLGAKISELNTVVLEVTETSNSLDVNYLFRKQNDINVFFRVGPGRIVNRSHDARGLVHCNARAQSCNRPRTGKISCDRTAYPVLTFSVDGQTVEVIDTMKGGDYLRAVALSLSTLNQSHRFCVLSDGECLECCLDYCLTRMNTLTSSSALILANPGISVKISDSMQDEENPSDNA